MLLKQGWTSRLSNLLEHSKRAKGSNLHRVEEPLPSEIFLWYTTHFYPIHSSDEESTPYTLRHNPVEIRIAVEFASLLILS
jgi:hypothetical protein